LGKKIDQVNLIVAHLGGGVTVAALKKGKTIDANNALQSGPFTPERAGTLPMLEFAEWCFLEGTNLEQVQRRMVGGGGLVAYLGTNNCEEIEKRIEAGDKKAKTVYEAMIYQIACEIGARAVALKGEINAIVLTGGLAKSEMLVNKLKEWISFLGKVLVYPGEDEMEALAFGALRVLRGEEEARIYPETVKFE
jgi:butyrate kinase